MVTSVDRDRAACLQTEVQLSRRPMVHFARPLFCSFLNVQTKKIFIIGFRMLSHRLNGKQSNHTFQSPFPLPTQLHVLSQTNVRVLGWQLLRRSWKALVLAMLYRKQNLLFHHKRKSLKFNFLLKFIFNDQTLLNSMYSMYSRTSYQKKLFEKNHDQNNEDGCTNFYFRFKSTSEIWKKFNRFFFYKTNKPDTPRLHGIPFYQDGLI